MQVSTEVLDVLPDGTITRLKLKTEPMAVTICRDEPDQYCIYSIDMACVDRSKTTLHI